MSQDDPKRWDAGLSALLQAERRNVSAPDEAEGRVWNKLAVGIAATGGGGGGHEGGDAGAGQHGVGRRPSGGGMRSGSRVGSALRVASTSATVSVYVLGVLTGIVGSVAVMRATAAPGPKVSSVYVSQSASPGEQEVVSQPVASPSASVAFEALPADTRVSARHAPGVVAVPRSSASGGHALEDERVLLDEARVALGRADANAALHATAVHAQRYPQGLLAEEREAIAIQALLLVPRYDEARQREAAFERQYPHSMLLQAVRASVQSIP